MKMTELDDLMVKVLAESDHPEITEVEIVPTPGRPDNHTRVAVQFASGAAAYVMVRRVVGSNGRRYPEYEVPKEAL